MITNSDGSISFPQLIILLLVIFLGVKFYGQNLEIGTVFDGKNKFKSDALVSVNSHSVLVEDAYENEIVYFRRYKSETLSGVAIAQIKSPHRNARSYGVSQTLIYLTPHQYDTVTNKFKDLDLCPANFLNENSQQVMLIAEEDSFSEKLHNFTIKRGDNISIQGSPLEVYQKEINGGKINFTVILPDNLEYFLIESIAINGKIL